jgi:hypothetical protein
VNLPLPLPPPLQMFLTGNFIARLLTAWGGPHLGYPAPSTDGTHSHSKSSGHTNTHINTDDLKPFETRAEMLRRQVTYGWCLQLPTSLKLTARCKVYCQSKTQHQVRD